MSLRDEGWKGGGGGGGVGGADAQGERRLKESLNKETVEIRARKDQEAELREAPGVLGSRCRHNERSQTYPASLISTIKANFNPPSPTPPLHNTPVLLLPRLQKALTCHLRSKQARGSAEAPAEEGAAALFLSFRLFSLLSFFFACVSVRYRRRVTACWGGGGDISQFVAKPEIRQGGVVD